MFDLFLTISTNQEVYARTIGSIGGGEYLQYSLPEIRKFIGLTEESVSKLHDIPLEQIREFADDPGRMSVSWALKWRKSTGVPIDYIKVQ